MFTKKNEVYLMLSEGIFFDRKTFVVQNKANPLYWTRPMVNGISHRGDNDGSHKGFHFFTLFSVHASFFIPIKVPKSNGGFY